MRNPVGTDRSTPWSSRQRGARPPTSSTDCINHAHQTDLRIAEHYTDTAGAMDHVFGLCHLLCYRFASRIKDLKTRKLYTVEKPGSYPML